MPFPTRVHVDHIYRGPIHERIERHNRFLLDHGRVRGYAVVCCGTSVANYLSAPPGGPKMCCELMRRSVPSRSGGAWVQDEEHASVEERHLATELMLAHSDSVLWPYTRLVAVGDMGCVAFDYPTIGGH